MSSPLESMLVGTKLQQVRKPKPAEQAMKCPRCDSTNTKFCYYNNYSLSQPRYFCKSCRRNWTKEGKLKNVIVGENSRKNKRSSSSSSSSKINQETPISITTDSNPLVSSLAPTSSYNLSLDLARIHLKQHNVQTTYDHEFSMMGNNNYNNQSVDSSSLSGGNRVFDTLRSGFLETTYGFQNNFYRGSMVGTHGEMGYLVKGGVEINKVGDDFEATGGISYADARTASSTAISSSIKQEGDPSNNMIL